MCLQIITQKTGYGCSFGLNIHVNNRYVHMLYSAHVSYPWKVTPQSRVLHRPPFASIESMLVNSSVTMNFHYDSVVGVVRSIEYVDNMCVCVIIAIDTDDSLFRSFMQATNNRLYANFAFTFNVQPPYPITTCHLSITQMPFSEHNSVLMRVEMAA